MIKRSRTYFSKNITDSLAQKTANFEKVSPNP